MSHESGASYGTLHEVACEARFGEAAYARAIQFAGLTPDRRLWRRYIDLFLVAVGAMLIIAGVAAFFAWNWAELGRFEKFGLVQFGIVGAAVLSWRLGLDSVGGKASLFAMGFLVGTLLAVYGQVYQTGADRYSLFLTWALLILPLCIIGRQAALWALMMVLLNLTLVFYYAQVLHPPDDWWQLFETFGPVVGLSATVMDSTLASYLFVLNIAALIAWEVGATCGIGWMRGRVFPRLIAFAAFGTVLPPSLIMIFAGAFTEDANLHFVSPALLTISVAGCLWYYQSYRRDLFLLTLCLLSVILVITSLAIRHMVENTTSLLFVAILIILHVGGAAWWLRQIALRWEQRS